MNNEYGFFVESRKEKTLYCILKPRVFLSKADNSLMMYPLLPSPHYHHPSSPSPSSSSLVNPDKETEVTSSERGYHKPTHCTTLPPQDSFQEIKQLFNIWSQDVALLYTV